MLFSRGSIFLLAATTIAVFAQPMRPVVVQGCSMSPTYVDGSMLWTTPVDRPLAHGDVVIADTPEGRVIKRVALLPGDQRFQWKTPIGWTDLADFYPPKSPSGRSRVRALVVPSDTVFLLGDNLDVSIDSRSFGPIPIAQVRRLVIDQRTVDERSGAGRSALRDWLAMGTNPSRLSDRLGDSLYPANL